MNKLLDNLLTIHENLSDIVKFVNIKMNVESLDQSTINYIDLVDNTDLLVKVLTKLGERIY